MLLRDSMMFFFSSVNGDCKYNQSLYVAMANLSRNQIHLSTEAAHAAK